MHDTVQVTGCPMKTSSQASNGLILQTLEDELTENPKNYLKDVIKIETFENFWDTKITETLTALMLLCKGNELKSHYIQIWSKFCCILALLEAVFIQVLCSVYESSI